MMRVPAAVAAVLLSVLLLAACGKTQSSSAPTTATGAASGASGQTAACSQVGTQHLPTASFALHAGLAFGAFHHFIYKPYRAGSLSQGAPHRVFNIAKAAAAAAFTYHELKEARSDAEASPTLCHLVAPLDSLESRFSTLGQDITTGNTANIGTANNNVSQLEQQSGSAGTPITEQVPPSV